VRIFKSLSWLLAIACMAACPSALAEVAPVAPATEQEEGDDDVPEAGATVREHVESLVRDAVLAYLQGMGIREQGLDVVVRQQMDSTGRIESLQAQIRITTDIEHPEQIGREARQAVQRALIDDGYRFVLPGVETAELPPEVASRPIAQVVLTVDYPEGPKGWQERLEIGPILVFTAIVLLMLAGFYLCWLMARRLWRTLRHAPTADLGPAPAQAYTGAAAFPPDLSGLPPLPGTMARQDPVLDLTPPPPLDLPSPGDATALPPTPGALEESDGPARQALISAFADMPFDKAVRALSAFDAATRHAIIDKLGLHLSVRRRIEQELAELSRS
jgi:hypothetical protein